MSEHTHANSFNHATPNDWKMYLGILIALLFLTVITVAAASFDFGAMNVIVAMAIATVKASLVALFFMHLRHDKMINSVIFLSALLFLSFLLILCLIDVNSRIDVRPANWKGPDPGVVSPAQLAPLPAAAGEATQEGEAPQQGEAAPTPAPEAQPQQ